jgi:hypothetical protein
MHRHHGAPAPRRRDGGSRAGAPVRESRVIRVHCRRDAPTRHTGGAGGAWPWGRGPRRPGAPRPLDTRGPQLVRGFTLFIRLARYCAGIVT